MTNTVTNTQIATSNVKTTEQPKAKLVKGTKKQQPPAPCKPLYGF